MSWDIVFWGFWGFLFDHVMRQWWRPCILHTKRWRRRFRDVQLFSCLEQNLLRPWWLVPRWFGIIFASRFERRPRAKFWSWAFAWSYKCYRRLHRRAQHVGIGWNFQSWNLIFPQGDCHAGDCSSLLASGLCVQRTGRAATVFNSLGLHEHRHAVAGVICWCSWCHVSPLQARWCLLLGNP